MHDQGGGGGDLGSGRRQGFEDLEVLLDANLHARVAYLHHHRAALATHDHDGLVDLQPGTAMTVQLWGSILRCLWGEGGGKAAMTV